MKRFLVLMIYLFHLPSSYPQWQMINGPSNVNDLIVSSSGKMLAATANGLYYSMDNGNTWDSTLINFNINKIKEDNLGNIFFNSGQLYKSSDDGINWINCITSDLLIVNFDISLNNDLVVAAYNWYNYILKSNDNGSNWDTIGTFASMQSVSRIMGVTQNSVNSIFFSSYDHTVGGIVVESKLLWRTTNNGANWNVINSDVYFNNLYFFQDTMYLAAENFGRYYNPPGIYKSYNDGNTLILINDGLINKNVKKIIITPSNVLLCYTYDGIYRSLNLGNYWQKLNHSGLFGGINSIYYSDDDILYACTNNGIGVFIGELPVELTSFTASINQNKVQLSWETATELNNNGFEIQRKLKNYSWATIGFVQGSGTTTEPVKYNHSDDISGVNSDTIFYRLKQIDFNGDYELSDEVEVVILPLVYSISQNYPNPFNPSTKIKYEIPENTKVKFEVFDILGNRVTTLVNGDKPAGRYEVELNASALSSGVYVYRIQTNGFSASKKMILMK